jgi:hypothetical protein
MHYREVFTYIKARANRYYVLAVFPREHGTEHSLVSRLGLAEIEVWHIHEESAGDVFRGMVRESCKGRPEVLPGGIS